jgi:ankyrin repeat protein
MSAILSGNLDMVKYVMKIGQYDIHNIRISIIYSLAENLELDVIKYFKSIGIKLDGANNVILSEAAKKDDFDIVKYMVENYPQSIHNGNENALVSATEHGHLDIIKYLLNLGKDKRSLKNKQEDVRNAHINPLYVAARNGNLDMVKYLVESIQINTRDVLKEAIRWAKEFSHENIIEYLENY